MGYRDGVRADEDLLVIPGRAHRSIRSARARRVVAKLGLDATRKAGRRDDWTHAKPPEPAILRARELLAAEFGDLRPVASHATP